MFRSLRERIARWICPELAEEADYSREPSFGLDGWVREEEVKNWIDFASGSSPS